MLLLSELARSIFHERSESELVEIDQAVASYLVLGNARILRYKLKALVGYDDVQRAYIAELIGQLRHRVDAKRMWKAMYEVLVGGEVEDVAANRYGVAVADVRFVQRVLNQEGRDRFVTTTKKEDVTANRSNMDELVRPLQRHTERLVRRLSFIHKYDAGLSAEDLQQDLLLRAFRTAYDYEHLQGSRNGVPHILNMARQSASSGSIDVLNYHTHESRARIVSRVFCVVCDTPAPLGIRQGKKRTCRCGSSEFKAHEGIPYETTTGPWTENTPNRTAQQSDSDLLEGHAWAHDLTAVLDSTTLRYLKILMYESNEFDAWLEQNNHGDAESLSFKKTRLLGAEFLGVPVARLDKTLRRAFQRVKNGYGRFGKINP